jgi:hypothetical protein
MSRFPLAIERYMSTVLVVISPSQPLSEAIRLMRLHEVRHLPVVTKGKIDGLISQRDIYLVQSFEHSAPSRILVSETMTRDPYTVEPDEPEHVVGVEHGPEGRRLLEHRDGGVQPVELDVDRLLARLGALDVGHPRLAAQPRDGHRGAERRMARPTTATGSS